MVGSVCLLKRDHISLSLSLWIWGYPQFVEPKCWKKMAEMMGCGGEFWWISIGHGLDVATRKLWFKTSVGVHRSYLIANIDHHVNHWLNHQQASFTMVNHHQPSCHQLSSFHQLSTSCHLPSVRSLRPSNPAGR